MSNNVIRYTPSAVEDNDTFIRLYDVEKTEIDNLHVSIHQVIKNSYLDTCDTERLSEWEEALDLPDGSDKSAFVRLHEIKDYLNFLPPITRYTLEELLIKKYGEGNYYFVIFKERYEIIIGVETAPNDYVEYMYAWLHINRVLYKEMNSQSYSQLMRFRGVQDTTNSLLADQSFRKFMRKIVPANMILTFSIMFMYAYLRGLYTYSELEQYTYAYLSQYSDWEDEYDDKDKKMPKVREHALYCDGIEWHTPPYVENHTLYIDIQDVNILDTIIYIKE